MQPNAAMRGLFIGLGFWLILVSLSVFLPAMSVLFLPTLPLHISLTLGLLLMPGAALTGHVAGTAVRNRFLKIFAAALLLYVACAIAAAAFMILGDPGIYPPDNALWRKLLGSLALGLTGAVLFGIPFAPVLALIVFFLERKTRPSV